MKFFCVPLFACKGQLVEALDYSQKKLTDVPKEVIKAKKTLEELNLSVNSIETLPPELFKCIRLKKLDISENKIKNVPDEIDELTDLMVLNLSKNDLMNLPETIGKCVNMVSLNLSNNMLSLSKCVMNLTQLTSLNISETATAALPAEIDQLVNLQHLDASQCDMSCLPNSIVRLSKLKVLDLCENHITELPERMDNLVSLESLDLRTNFLTRIPESLLQCKELQTLDLSQNSLTSLPEDLGDLDKMVELVLCENSLPELPTSIGNMRRLEVLKVTKNSLTKLTPSICRCVNLTDLYLGHNLLQELPSSLGNLNKLRFLDVSGNRLEAVPSTIGNCCSLGVLALRENQITELPMEIGKLARLRVLDVAFNRLNHLPYTVKVLEDLQALWLSVKQPPLPHLHTIDLPNKIKALTCCYLPQLPDKGIPIVGDQTLENELSQYGKEAKSMARGPRVVFSSSGADATYDDEDESQYKLGLQRYDTPHPKPFAPKNRMNKSLSNSAKDPDTSAESQSETRPLRSVLKKRPVSQHAECQLTEERGDPITIHRDHNGLIGWTIMGGLKGEFYKNVEGIFVSYVVPEGPASKAGIQADDKILSVNGITMRDLSHGDAIKILEDAGEQLELRIERIPFETDEPTTMAPMIPELEAAPRPPSRSGSVIEFEMVQSGNDAAVSQGGQILDINKGQNAGAQAGINGQVRLNGVQHGISGGTSLSSYQGLQTEFSSTNGIQNGLPYNIGQYNQNNSTINHGKETTFKGTNNTVPPPLNLSQDDPLPAPPTARFVGIDNRNGTHFGAHVNNVASYGTGLPSARSMPSLVEINLFENTAPPVPPRRSGSRSNLNADFDVKGFLNSLKKTPAPARPSSSLTNKSFEDVAADIQAANPAISNVEFVDRMEPLAASSPVPPKSKIPKSQNFGWTNQTHVTRPGSVTSASTNYSYNNKGDSNVYGQSRIPGFKQPIGSLGSNLNGQNGQKLNETGQLNQNSQGINPNGQNINQNSQNINQNATTHSHSKLPSPTELSRQANGRHRQINPPPVAPKPSLEKPERLDFNNKIRHF
ncbi:unnamed protein product [Bursaphelenchus okinawaensis]|uniref:PDZ domain-containing protein n=1 Tax=Bursaphelenchus okinawaensis TaxID=465554 RepID=A0A811LMD0_9BILA|nr:unnamed protein product [Bursaphelenchus okinawaensis]CAG9124091.1 unnamed protein product [Bursaphelenchus okinawaensis]